MSTRANSIQGSQSKELLLASNDNNSSSDKVGQAFQEFLEQNPLTSAQKTNCRKLASKIEALKEKKLLPKVINYLILGLIIVGLGFFCSSLIPFDIDLMLLSLGIVILAILLKYFAEEYKSAKPKMDVNNCIKKLKEMVNNDEYKKYIDKLHAHEVEKGKLKSHFEEERSQHNPFESKEEFNILQGLLQQFRSDINKINENRKKCFKCVKNLYNPLLLTNRKTTQRLVDLISPLSLTLRQMAESSKTESKKQASPYYKK